ncbi:hypothetical protein V6Z11_A05G370200 [Gossypium hirsutum]
MASVVKAVVYAASKLIFVYRTTGVFHRSYPLPWSFSFLSRPSIF